MGNSSMANVEFENMSNHRGLNKNEIQLNLCNLFSILILNELHLFH